MKVLLANKYFFRKGGAEAVMFMQRDFLKTANIEIIDFSMRDDRNLRSPYSEHFVTNQNYDEAKAGRVSQLRSALKVVHSPEAVRQIGRLIDRTRPDVVHCHNVYHQLTPSIIGAAKRRGVPVVLTLHDYKPVCPVHTRLRNGEPCSACIEGQFVNVLRHRCAGGSISRSAVLLAEAWSQRLLRSYEKLDAVIAPSEFMRTSVTKSRFPADRVHVIPNGVDTNRLRPTHEDRGYALYLGRLSPEKGVETLLAAHETIADHARLVVAGTGPFEQSLRQRYPRARFLGHLDGAALESTIRQAAVIVLPSECYENCPMSVLEAMSCGKTVIASDIGGIPELVAHGETGLLFPAGHRDALAKHMSAALTDPELRRRYGAAGRVRAERLFSIDRQNVALLRLYRNLLPHEDPQGALAALSSATQD